MDEYRILDIEEGSLLHRFLCRAANAEDLKIMREHPLWCKAFMMFDIVFKDKFNNLGLICKDASLRDALLVNTNRNQIPWLPDTDGYLNEGDTITITNQADQKQTFKLTKNVSIGDTKLEFEMSNIKYIFHEGDDICLSSHEVYRRWDLTQTTDTITVDVPLPDPNAMSIEELVKTHTLLKNGQRMVAYRTPVNGIDYGYAIVDNTIVLGMNPGSFDIYELFIKDPHQYA